MATPLLDLLLIGALAMADNALLALANESGASGSWDAPPAQRNLLGTTLDYGRSLPARVMTGWADEGRRLAELGRAGPKEQAREMFGLGHFVDSYDAAKEGRYLPAAGNAALGVADLAGPARSKAAGAADALLQSWETALKLRPGQLAARAEQELQKLLPASGRFNAYSKAHKGRIADSNRAAERAIPEPAVPGWLSTSEAERRLGAINRAWPGQLATGALVAGGASGVPGMVLDDAKDALGPPIAAMDREVRDYAEPDKAYRTDDPHIKKIAGDMKRTNDVLAGHIGAGAAASVATPWLAQKGWQLGSRAGLGLLPFAAEIGMHNPFAGLVAAGLITAPMAIPMLPAAATGIGALKAAGDTGPLREHALEQKTILDDYGRRGEDRFGPEAQSRYPREGY